MPNYFDEENFNEDDQQNELNFLRARRENGEKLDPDELLMLGLIED
jgi:hypothetical protein